MTYKKEILKTVTELKDRNGSSMVAIRKVMKSTLPAEKKWLNATFLAALKSMVASGELQKVKNSFKLPTTLKTNKKAAVPSKLKKKVPLKKKPAPKKKTLPQQRMVTKKKPVPNKVVTKKEKKTTPEPKAKAKSPTKKKQ